MPSSETLFHFQDWSIWQLWSEISHQIPLRVEYSSDVPADFGKQYYKCGRCPPVACQAYGARWIWRELRPVSYRFPFIGSWNGPIFFFTEEELNLNQMLVIKTGDNDNRTSTKDVSSYYQTNAKVKTSYLSANKHCTGGKWFIFQVWNNYTLTASLSSQDFGFITTSLKTHLVSISETQLIALLCKRQFWHKASQKQSQFNFPYL